MKNTPYAIITKKRFLPLFITQFLGAFNDNLFKNALIVLITFKIAGDSVFGIPKEVMVTVATGLFILPYLLFSSIAGQLSDKLEKSRLIRLTKVLEIIIMFLAAYGFLTNNVTILLGLLFLMGMQSTFFGPSKYSILPDHLKENELLTGNGLLEGATFIAILTGMIFGVQIIEMKNGEVIFAVVAIIIAIAGYASSWFIPKAKIASPKLTINKNLVVATINMMKYAKTTNRTVFLSILGTSWFWLLGSVFMAQFPIYTAKIIGGDSGVYTLFLTMFSIGIAIGSALCGKIQKGKITAEYVPIASLFITVFTLLMVWASPAVPAIEEIGIIGFFASPRNWLILLFMLAIAICGGLYSVPLKAIIQSRSEAEHRSRVIAAENIFHALFMVVAAVVSALLLAIGFDVLDLFLGVAILNLFVAIYITTILPDILLKTALRWTLRKLFKIEVIGIENYKTAGDRVLIIPNHQSFLDALLLVAFLPDKPAFAMNSFVAEKWYLRPLMNMFDIFRMDPSKPLSMKSLIHFLEHNNRVVLFPEGRITTTGSLMKIYDGAGMIIDKSGAKVLPIRFDGAEFSKLSRMKGILKLRFFPKIIINILPAQILDIHTELKGRKRREISGTKLYEIMSDMMFKTSNYNCSILEGLVQNANRHGRKTVIATDVKRSLLTYNDLLTKSFVLSEKFKDIKQENVAVLLPNSNATLVAFFALQIAGKTPAMLNFSTGVKNLISACFVADIDTIITSRKFVEVAKFEDNIEKLNREVIYLEDLNIGIFDKLKGLLKTINPRKYFPEISPDNSAVILYTSGSEGTPKGVVLSHRNIMANIYQAKSRIDLTPNDIVLNALPMFHSFGLSIGTLLPVMSGMKTFLYPTPLHYSVIPEICYDQNATIILGTDTFFFGYARKAHPYDFYKIRYAIGGAEKIKDETRNMWFEKFGVRILEGYGATEASPLIAFNSPIELRTGTVGKFVSGMEYKLEPTPAGNRLFIKGANLMKGYLKIVDYKPIFEPLDDWYDTGDIVEVDEDGYIKIVGRAKRFAKIGGEMVSLIAVEEFIGHVWDGYIHAILAKPDPKKGEQLILITDYAKHSLRELRERAKEEGMSELFLPKSITYMRKVPLLGSGKVNYPKLMEEV